VWASFRSLHLQASEVEHAGPEPQEVVPVAAAAPGRSLLSAQAAAEAEAVAVAVAGLQRLPLDEGGLEVQLLVLLLAVVLMLARRADAEVQVEVRAPGRLDARRLLGLDRRLRCCFCGGGGGGVGAGLERDGGRGAPRDTAVRDGVDAAAQQLAPDVRVPVVLDLVVRPPREPRGDERPPAGRGKATTGGRSSACLLAWFGWVRSGGAVREAEAGTYLFPRRLCSLTMRSSSSAVKLPRLRSGRR
jgi:hypothetical protein